MARATHVTEASCKQSAEQTKAALSSFGWPF
jgi:hypothetical protein